MATSTVIPPLPKGYMLDQTSGVPPLPAGYALDAPAAATAPADKPWYQQTWDEIKAGKTGDPYMGALKGTGSTLWETSGLINKGIRMIPGAENYVPPMPAKPDILNPKGVGEKAGYLGEQLGEFFAPGPSKGKLGVRILKEAAKTAGVTAAQGGDTEDVGIGAVLGGAAPLIGKGIEKATEYAKGTLPYKRINSLIRPYVNDLKTAMRFGQNPSAGIVDEGIVAKNWDDLVTKLRDKSNQIRGIKTNELGAAGQRGATVDLGGQLQTIDSAMADAQKYGQRDLYKELSGIKEQLLFEFAPDVNGKLVPVGPRNLGTMNPLEAEGWKQKIGEETNFSKHPNADVLEKVQNQLYGGTNAAIESSVPGTKELNKRIANIRGAEKASENEAALAAKGNTRLGGMMSGVVGGIAGSAGGPGTAVAGGYIGKAAAEGANRGVLFNTTLAQLLKKVPPTARIVPVGKNAFMVFYKDAKQSGASE